MTTLDSILSGYSSEDFVFSPSIRSVLEQDILSQLATANREAAIHNTTLTVEGLASKAAEVEGVDSPAQLSGQVLAEVSQVLGQGEQTLTEECLTSIANLVDGFMPPAQEVATVTSRIASQTGSTVLNEYLNAASTDLQTSAQVLLERGQQANGQQINVHAGNLIQHTSGAIVQRSNGPIMVSAPSAQTTARTIVNQSSYDINIADAHHQESRVSFHNHESLIQNLGQEATSIQGGRTVAAQEQSLVATNSFQTTAETLQFAAAETYSLAANQVEQSIQEGINTRAAFAMEQYGSLSPIEEITEVTPAALQDIQSTLNRFTSLEGAINGLIQMIGQDGANVRINRGIDYQTASVEVQVTEGVTLSSRGGYVELTAGGVTLRGIPGFDIQPPDELLLAANEIKEGLESINALLNLSQLTQDLRECEPQAILQRREEKRKTRKSCQTQQEKGFPLGPECEDVVIGIPPSDRGNNPITLPSPSSGSNAGGSDESGSPSTSSESNRNNFPTLSPNVSPLSRLSASVAGSAALGGSIDTWMTLPAPDIERSTDPALEITIELDQEMATELAQRENQGDVPQDILRTLPSNFNGIVQIPGAPEAVELPDGITIPIISDQNRIQSSVGSVSIAPTPVPEGVTPSDLSSVDQQTLVTRLLDNFSIDATYESLREFIPPEIDLAALVALSEIPEHRNDALIQLREILSNAVLQEQMLEALGPEYSALREPLVGLVQRGIEPEALPGALFSILGSIDPRLSSLESIAETALQEINPFNGSLEISFNGLFEGLEQNDPLALAVSAAAIISQEAVREELLAALQDGRTAQDVLLAVMGQIGGPVEVVKDVIDRVSTVRDVINSGVLGDLIERGDFTGLLGQISSLDPTGFISGTLETVMPLVDLFQTLVKVPDMLSVLSQSNRPLLQRFNLLLGCLDLIRKIEAVLDLFRGDEDDSPEPNPLELNRQAPARAMEFLPLQIQLINSIQRLPASSIPSAQPASARAVLSPEGTLQSVVVVEPGSGYRPDYDGVRVPGSEVRATVSEGSIGAIEVIRGGQYTTPPPVYINPQAPLPGQIALPPEVLNQIYRVDLTELSDECFQVPRLTLTESRLSLSRLQEDQVFFSRLNPSTPIPIRGIIQLLIPRYQRLSDGVTLYAYQREHYYTPLFHTATIRDYNLDSNQGLAVLDPTTTFYLEDEDQNVSAYTYADFGSRLIPDVTLVYLVA